MSGKMKRLGNTQRPVVRMKINGRRFRAVRDDSAGLSALYNFARRVRQGTFRVHGPSFPC